MSGVLRNETMSDLYRGLVDPFDGSPKKFRSSKVQMRSNLDEAVCGPADELHIIFRNTTGAPKAMIRDLLDNCFAPRRRDMIPRDSDVASFSPEDELPGLSRDDKKFLDIMESGISINQKGNLEMPLPFKNVSKLPNNRSAVYMRTVNTLSLVKKDAAVAAKRIKQLCAVQ